LSFFFIFFSLGHWNFFVLSKIKEKNSAEIFEANVFLQIDQP
jgi:hypothetical protein